MFIAGKGMQRSKVQGTCGYVKGVPFVNRRYLKGVQKQYKVKGLGCGAEPPNIKLFGVLPRGSVTL